MARLDVFLVTPDIHANISKHILSFGYRSDHSLVGIELNTVNSECGKFFMKFNSALLKEKRVCNTGEKRNL